MIKILEGLLNALFCVRKKRRERKALVNNLLVCADEAVKVFVGQKGKYVDLVAKGEWIKKYEPLKITIDQTRRIKSFGVIQAFLDTYRTPEETRRRVNSSYIESELAICKEMFDHVEGRALDSYQRECIVKNEVNSLVIAGAGSGKTTVIVGKVKYLIKRLGYRPEELLILSFTNASAAELRHRIQKEIDRPTDVFTFHKLGKEIIAQTEGKQPCLTDIRLEDFIKTSAPQIVKEPYYLHLLNEYFMSYMKEYKSVHDFANQTEYRSYLADQRIRTLQNEDVLTFEEMFIADFLFTNGICYQIRPYIKTNRKKHRLRKKRMYKPMIYLPEYRIVIEHYSINDPDKICCRHVNEMRKLHTMYGLESVETYSYELLQGVLLHNLEQKLLDRKVKFSPMSPETIWGLISTKDNLQRFVSVAATFMTHMKANDMTVQELSRQNSKTDAYHQKRNQLFLNILAPIYYAYEEQLQTTKTIDFNDMINKAANYVQEGKLSKKYRYIIVDEYQDISVPRYRLIKSVKDVCHASLFCVGDDWQSIYRFAGSNINLFVGFEHFLGPTERSFIRTTYRFNSHLAAVSSHFVLKNKNQIKKQFLCSKDDSLPAIHFIYSVHKGDLTRRLTQVLKMVPSGNSVLLLGRYRDDIHSFLGSGLTLKQTGSGQTFISYARRPDMDIEFMTVHKSKGLQADVVFILNNSAGKFGFPSKMTDDSVMDLLIDRSEHYPYAEERRLFYVALTRAKARVYLLVDRNDKSVFVKELEEDMIKNPELRTKQHCPFCKLGVIERDTGSKGIVECCSNRPLCEYIKKI
ncbi:MAG TPA: hypothetical protein DDZ89_09540 [Clostridiales bacterium]|nr:hypothetical protein [Clostridiales bacterium]